MLARCLVLLLASAGVATAGEATPDEAADASPRLYTDAALWAGGVRGEMRFADGFAHDANAYFSALRYSGGLELGLRARYDLRVGPALDLVWTGDDEGIAFGLEVQVDHPLDAGWRIGGRISASLGQETEVVDGQVVMAGLRLRNPIVTLGVDAVFARRGDTLSFGYANGVMVGAGIGNRPGRYAFVASAGIAAVVGIVGLVLMAQAPNH